MGLGTAAVGVRETASSSVRRYFEMAADRLGLHSEMRRLLSVPFRELTVEIPLRRDDDRLQLFRGYRVQHNGVRGPVLGPIRIQPGLELETLRASAESMTWRCAVANVPFGGASGGIACDLAQLNRKEVERLVRKYTARIHHVLGMYHDICAPGLNASEEVISWIGEEYASLQKGTLAAVLGKSAKAGGLAAREAVLGRAMASLAIRASQDSGLAPTGLRVAIQSLDRSGFYTAKSLAESGCVIVGVLQEGEGLYCSTGINIPEVTTHLSSTGSLAGFEGAAPTNDLEALDCDVLILAAHESTLDFKAASRITAKLVVEASELVITPAADRVLANKGVVVVPDLIGAAGSILAAHVEWSNNVQQVASDDDRVQREVESGVMRAYQLVRERSRRETISMRMAAYVSAIERVARCERLRVA
jgi:glutamate dehydrogenase (NAD(P)+)